MGFNNDGAEAVADRLARRAERLDRRDRRLAGRIGQRPRRRPVLGINIGKTKVVPEDDEQAVLADYAFSARLLAPYADYLVVNVSSPNTPGLRSLQAVERLAPLLDEVRRVADEAAGGDVPLCVKIAPDLADDDVVAVAELARSHGLDGIIATNTTISREGLRTDAAEVAALGAGGLSGPVLRKRSLEVLRILRAHDPRIAIISVGGITSTDDALARVRAGADLVQAYTAFVYGGPRWPRRIASALTEGVTR
jgi:dihydroorotate dehydrogenase